MKSYCTFLNFCKTNIEKLYIVLHLGSAFEILIFHMMNTAVVEYRIRQCSKCSGDLKYFCVTCSSDLCLQCGENHIMKNSTKDIHNVILYREKSNYLQKHEICLRHQNNVYTTYCELCRIPICSDCTEHRTHKQIDIGTAYEEKRKNREIIRTVQSQTLPFRYAFLADIGLDFKTVFSEVVHLNSEILRNSEKLTGCLDNVLHYFSLEHRCLKQKIKIKKNIDSIKIYEDLYEHSSNAPIKFLLSEKKHHLKTFEKHAQFSLTKTKSLKTEAIIEKLLKIKLTNKGKRLAEKNEYINRRLNTQLVKMIRDPMSLLAFAKDIPTILSQVPGTFMSEPWLGE